MNFTSVRIHVDSVSPGLDVGWIGQELASHYLPHLPIEIQSAPWIRQPEVKRRLDSALNSARVNDVKLPLEKQSRCLNYKEAITDKPEVLVYDGWLFQEIISEFIPADTVANALEVIITDHLNCTFDFDSYRYHARTLLCGKPSVISIRGIIEGPARPKEYYWDNLSGLYTISELQSKYHDTFVEYADPRISAIVVGCILQAAFYFIADGNPFCPKQGCRLFNSHWQEELLKTQTLAATLCDEHKQMLDAFNVSSEVQNSLTKLT